MSTCHPSTQFDTYLSLLDDCPVETTGATEYDINVGQYDDYHYYIRNDYDSCNDYYNETDYYNYNYNDYYCYKDYYRRRCWRRPK